MLVIIDYGSGNLRSAAKAFECVAPDRQIQVTSTPEVLRQASHIVLPGVGAFADCMTGLAAIPGMIETLEEEVRGREKQFLGICVGMQMLFERGHEHGVHKGLGWLDGEVVSLSDQSSEPRVQNQKNTLNSELRTLNTLKIPHMGWNEMNIVNRHPLTDGIASGAHAYFVHSYHALCRDENDIVATTAYGQNIAAVVARGNIMGTQFHPEKSQETGLKLLKNFLSL